MGTSSPRKVISKSNRYNLLWAQLHLCRTSFSPSNFVTWRLLERVISPLFPFGLVVMRRRILFENSIFFYSISSPWERAALYHRIICQQSCPTANSFSFKQNKCLHYSGCHLYRRDCLSLRQAAGLHTYQKMFASMHGVFCWFIRHRWAWAISEHGSEVLLHFTTNTSKLPAK